MSRIDASYHAACAGDKDAMAEAKPKLAAISSADAVGGSRLMGAGD